MAASMFPARCGAPAKLQQCCIHQLRCICDYPRGSFIKTSSPSHMSTASSSRLAPLSSLAPSTHHQHLASSLARFSCHPPSICASPAGARHLCHSQVSCCAEKMPPNGTVADTNGTIAVERVMLGLPEEDDSLSVRMLKRFGRMSGFYSKKNIFTRAGMKLYADLIDNINYFEFFKVCRLPDTLQSWFLVAHLHVWFLMVRLKREGKDGDYIIRQIVKTFWGDVENRMRMLGISQSRAASMSMRDLVQQFYGITIAYEEGLLSDDKVLASALWRNLVFEKEDTDPVMLATMVDYIRRQVLYMDSLDSSVIMVTGNISLLPLCPK